MSDRDMIQKIRYAAHAGDHRYDAEIASLAFSRAGGGMHVADTAYAYLHGAVTPALLERILDQLVYRFCYQKRSFTFVDASNNDRLFSVGVWSDGGPVSVELRNVKRGLWDLQWVCSVRENAQRIARENGLSSPGQARLSVSHSSHGSPGQQVARARAALAALARAYDERRRRDYGGYPAQRVREDRENLFDQAFSDWTEAERARVYLRAHLNLHPR